MYPHGGVRSTKHSPPTVQYIYRAKRASNLKSLELLRLAFDVITSECSIKLMNLKFCNEEFLNLANI
ncbi:hypothetical protein AB6A40_010236 [Gnathostoma spinigerum]|uniref:Uncharacterized protein n=1 Tax=Gnathostoma spinigerum TaxID=75299 RepID=A0ABD6F2C2_9BILA